MTEEYERQDTDIDWIIETRFEPRQPNIDLVVRTHLHEKLDKVLGGKVAFIIAPAGYGKSTLLYQWNESLKERKIRSAWLTLEPSDSDPRQFLAYMVMSLSKGGVNIGELAVGAMNAFADTPTELIMAKLLRLIKAYEHQVVFILEDYHHIASNEIDVLLDNLLSSAPANLAVALNSRVMPEIGSPKLFASGHALRLDANELCLTEKETGQILDSVATESDTQVVFDLTEGWPVAVQLAKVHLQNNPHSMGSMHSSSGLIASYLTDQILSSLDQSVVQLLLNVCLLDRFNISLASAVTNNAKTDKIFELLKPLTALLISLDMEKEWYRLHHLFAEYLRERLNRDAPDKASNILHIASEWYEERGYLVEAVKYAAKAGNYKRCEQLILHAGGWKIILYQGISTLRSLLRYVPESYISLSPRLMVAKAYLHCKDGEHRQARGILDVAHSLVRPGEDQPFEKDHLIIESMVNVYEDRRQWTQSFHMCQEREDLLSELEPVEAGTLHCEECLIHLALGDFGQADMVLKSAFGFMRKSGSVLGLNYCYIHASVMAFVKTDFPMARANINRALELAENNFGSDSGLKHMAQAMDFSLEAWKGNATGESLQKLNESLRFMEEFDGWVELVIIVVDAAVHLSLQLNNPETGLEIAERFLKVARERRLLRLDIFCQVLKMKCSERLGRHAQAFDIYRQVGDWLEHNMGEREARNWQCFFVAAATLPEFSKGNKKHHLRVLDAALDWAKDIGAVLHEIRLRIARAKLLNDIEKAFRDSDDFMRALRLAAREQIKGPFICDADTLQYLKKAREVLRNNENDLLSLNFIEAALNQLDELRPKKIGTILSARELEILEQLSMGQSNKEIANLFELTENTVKFHLKNIYTKLSVNRRTQAIAEAHRLGLLD